MPRIAVAGFQHETNSFGTGVAGMAEYVMADSWPGLLTGDGVISGTRGMNLPITGAINAAPNADLFPILWGSAEPSGPVTDAAFETITARILDGIANANPDGIYIDLHGAMITNSHDDGEGELLRRIRALVGPDLPIAISLDMHGNVTAAMVEHATSVAIYRTYPHLDMAETGGRAMSQLLRQIDGHRPFKAFRQLPYIIPMHAQYTGAGAMGDLFQAAILASGTDQQVELAVGFPSGDMVDTGPAIVAHASTQARADAAADALLECALEIEPTFECHLPSAAEAVRLAMALPTGKPVTIADVQDNPGGGTSSDTTGLLRALAEARASGVLFGVMHDAEAAALAHQYGIGATIETPLGGRSRGDTPFQARFTVEALSDGKVAYEGEMYGGGIAEVGPSACLKFEDQDIRVVVSTIRNQCLDRGYFRHLGLTPEKARILAVKSTVHYRADFEPISQAVISAGAPGQLICDIEAIPYRKLRHGVRLGPLGPAYKGPVKPE